MENSMRSEKEKRQVYFAHATEEEEEDKRVRDSRRCCPQHHGIDPKAWVSHQTHTLPNILHYQ